MGDYSIIARRLEQTEPLKLDGESRIGCTSDQPIVETLCFHRTRHTYRRSLSRRNIRLGIRIESAVREGLTFGLLLVGTVCN